MKAAIKIAIALVLFHLLVVVVHGAAHSHLRIPTLAWQNVFIAVVIFAAPLLATVLLWTRWHTAGFLVLGLSFAGSLIFGLFYHFLVSSPDHVSHVAHTAWGATFRLTAALLAIVETAGCLLGMQRIRRILSL